MDISFLVPLVLFSESLISVRKNSHSQFQFSDQISGEIKVTLKSFTFLRNIAVFLINKISMHIIT